MITEFKYYVHGTPLSVYYEAMTSKCIHST